VRLSADLPVLSERERSCLERYVDLLVETLGERVLEVSVFGSVARGESWPRGMPIRSDLDLLVLTDAPLQQDEIDDLVVATLPLFLECGRQLGPQFRTRQGLAEGSPEFGAGARARRDRSLRRLAPLAPVALEAAVVVPVRRGRVVGVDELGVGLRDVVARCCDERLLVHAVLDASRPGP
jgi:predicted nucleotidyltransferase